MDWSFFLEPTNLMIFGIIAFLIVSGIWGKDVAKGKKVKWIPKPSVSGTELEKMFGL